MRLGTGGNTIEEVRMCSRGALVIAERAVRALDGHGSEGWGERALSMWLNGLYMQQPTLDLG